jgi:predicted site-specific integrase-resolvase
MANKTAAVYVRVSTTDQHTELQETELRDYCEHRGWRVRVYRDAGQSGAKDNRPALIQEREFLPATFEHHRRLAIALDVEKSQWRVTKTLEKCRCQQ